MEPQSGIEGTRPSPVSLAGEVLDRLGQGMIHLDASLSLTYMNANSARLLRQDMEGLVGQALQDAVPGLLGQELTEAIREVLKKDDVARFEGYYPAPLDLWLHIHCLPLEQGVLVIFQDITREKQQEENIRINKALSRESKESSAQGISQEIEDITGFKLTQTALHDSQEKLRLAHKAGKIGMFDWDVVSNTNILSDELKMMYGVPPDFIGTMENWAKITPPEDIRKIEDKTRQAIAQHQREVEGEYRIIRPDGGVRWISSRGLLYYDDADRPIRIIGAAIDITDLKGAQELLTSVNEELEERVQGRTRELEKANIMLKAQKEALQGILDTREKMEQDLQLLATAIDQAGEGFVLFNTDWVIEYVNPAYEQITGYTKEELIGKSVEFLDSDLISDLYPEMLYMVVSKGVPWRGRIKRIGKSGEIIELHLTLSPVRNRAGEVIKYVSVAKDLTQEVRFQQITAQSQKMEAIGTLAGGIAHDLKNIFVPILLNTESAVEEVGKDSPVCPLLEEVLEAARMGADLVNQIMTFTRQASEKKIPINISSTVSEALALLRAAIPKTIEIRTRVNTDDAVVRANPTQIKQVLMNLGSNAAYAMGSKRGLLEVNVSRIDLDKYEASKISPDLSSGSYVEVYVRDTGEGMDEKILERIFDPFFTTKQHGEGTGMGLSVVQGIVKDHQGTVSVWSRPGKGSTFRVLLPRLEKRHADEGQV